ncbi:hypothetical protein, partial [Xanthomonas nasturtii]|uniref:hypothetical protein n=1 Tax=Xanthomonas nasturtii TaxID=1843581 RepID=UPI0020123ABD
VVLRIAEGQLHRNRPLGSLIDCRRSCCFVQSFLKYGEIWFKTLISGDTHEDAERMAIHILSKNYTDYQYEIYLSQCRQDQLG